MTPALIDELNTWEKDPYFLNSIRQFGQVNEPQIQLAYDPFIVENHLEFHTGKFDIIFLPFL